MKKRRSNPWRRLRLGSQVLFFGLFVYIIWATKHPLEGFINPKVFFQLDPLVMAVTSLAERLWLPGLGLALATLVLTLAVGRIFCGWFCPLGATLDFVGWLARRWQRKETGPSAWLESKTVLLGLTLVMAAFGIQFVWLFDPLAIFVRTFSFIINPSLNAGTDRAFAWLLPAVDFWPPLESTYDWLKAAVLDISNPRFPHAGVIGWLFAAIVGLTLVRRRFWCRHLCPLGALLGQVARFSWLRRDTQTCTHACGVCRQLCPTNAIRQDNTTLTGECVMCLNCVEGCPSGKSRFSWGGSRQSRSVSALEPGKGISRGQFLALAAGSLLITAAKKKITAADSGRTVIRPPAALPEGEFVDRCVRCGNCMKVCLTNGLQPAGLESGGEGIWSPRLVPEIGYCEYQCTLCGQVCPTGAIRPLRLEEKRHTRLGLAMVHRDRCLPWAEGTECLVCEEHCPVADKAIKIDEWRAPDGRLVGRPVVDPALCVGCSICENKCPVRPRAITIRPV